jgi:hypothetical protein
MRFFIAVCFVIALASCKPDITGPIPFPDCNYSSGNRDFTWRADTVAWFPSRMGGIWAFADDDAYVMGSIIRYENGQTQGYLGLRWNGTEWTKDINGSVEEIKHVANDVIGDKFYMVSVGNWSITPSKPGIGEFDNRTKKWIGHQYETEGELRSVWTDGNGFFMATGDNGTTYSKDGYNAEWVYALAPTDYHLTKITGISKNEIYIQAFKYTQLNEPLHQLWKLHNGEWFKLMDTVSPSGLPIQVAEAEGNITDLAVFRCDRSDSLSLYLTGWESFRFMSVGQHLTFEKHNLKNDGLPLRAMGQSAWQISVFSPNDIWIRAARYQMWHWNGLDYQKIEPDPSWPYGQLWGSMSRMQCGPSGKIWMLLETNSQVYSVVHGTP